MLKAIFTKVKQALSKTRSLFASVAELFGFRGKVDQKFLDELEKRLYLADVGTYATTEIVQRVKQAYHDKEVDGAMIDFVKNNLRSMLTEPPGELIHYTATGPTVIMVAGVNGAGKTTSIAKLAKWFQDQNKKVMVAACDTFRAAGGSNRFFVDLPGLRSLQGSDA